MDEQARGCGKELTVVQRGASNVYFPVVRSSLFLPTWSASPDKKIDEFLDENWVQLREIAVTPEALQQVIAWEAKKRRLDPETLAAAFEERRRRETEGPSSVGRVTEEEYRRLEYNALLSGNGSPGQDFHATVRNVSEYKGLGGFISSVVLAHKLRETRAFAGFTRLSPDCGATAAELRAQLARRPNIQWLPAVVVRGEGIFLQLDHDRLAAWAAREAVKRRVALLAGNYNEARKRRGLQREYLNARFVLIHTLAHLIVNRLSYVCGYGSSSIRERLFVDRKTETPESPMNGVLIYTASGDSEGSLGGLVRQGKPGLLEDILWPAIEQARWCSSDPICIDSSGQGPDNCNLAACHNCTLLPETCCEHGNRLLDRALLVGTPSDPSLAFFASQP